MTRSRSALSVAKTLALWVGSLSGPLEAAAPLLSTACNKSDAPAGDARNPPGTPASQPSASLETAPRPPWPASAASAAGSAASACGHSVCADNFVVDAVPPAECAAGAVCTLAVKLTALGEFHVNDEYPYRFKANETDGVSFAGKDPGGKLFFTKSAGDWRKSDAKSGDMLVKFTPASRGSQTIAGTFKLSVCSAQNCLLEQRPIAATVVAR